MKSSTMQRAISATLFGLGVLVGMAGCAIYPMAVFSVGANDSSQEVWGISLVFLSLFPTCILALRFRLLAGCMMLFVPCFYIYSTIAQRSFMINVRHFAQPPIDSKQIMGSFVLTWPYLVLGGFAVAIADSVDIEWNAVYNESASAHVLGPQVFGVDPLFTVIRRQSESNLHPFMGLLMRSKIVIHTQVSRTILKNGVVGESPATRK